MIKIKIVRHAERLDFTHPIYWMGCIGQYWSDTPLTSNGHKTALEKGKIMLNDNINPKFIYTSPYKRTMQTSAEIKKSFPKSQIVIEPLVAEHQPNYKHTIELYPEGIPTTHDGVDTEFTYPESYENLTSRIKFIINKLIEKNDNDLIVVTHGEVVKVCVNYLQTLFPDLLLDSGTTPYLTCLTFDYDKKNEKIVKESIKIN